MHGVQPMPNSGAPASPARGVTDGLKIRPANMNLSNAPKNSSPSTTVTPPRIRVSSESCADSSSPRPPTASPVRANTAENPATNSAVPATVRPVRLAVDGVAAFVLAWVVTLPAALVNSPLAAVAGAVSVTVASAPDMPVMYARYPGTSGRQHGERNVTAPAAAATGIASSSGPDDTRLMTLIGVPPRADATMARRCSA